MIKRLGLVIHWIGSIIGVVSFLGFTLTAMTAGFGWFLVSPLFGALFGLPPHICGWVVKFILTGNKQFFPFDYSAVKASWDSWRS